MPTLTTPIQHNTGSPRKARKRNERHLNQNEISKIVSVGRLYDHVWRKCQRLHQKKKKIGTNYKFSKLQDTNQHAEISCISKC